MVVVRPRPGPVTWLGLAPDDPFGIDHLPYASAVGAARLVLERDASIEAADRRILREELRRVDDTTMRYGHLDAHEEPLLWVADAVAWAQQAGGDWPRRFAPLVQQIRRLDRETRR